MNRCPKCNNSLSSSDVLCPRCGAMVEQINTKVSVRKPQEKTESEASEAASIPDYDDSIIMYNETYPILEQELPESPKEASLEEEPEDFDIEEMISASGSSHVNPLLAHIKKQSEIHDDEGAENIDVTDEDESNDELIEYGSVSDTSDEPDELPADDYFEEVQEPEEEPSVPPAAAELQKIAEDLLSEQPVTKAEDGFPINGMPAYSKSYLEAIMNLSLPDEELDTEEEFDPDAFMENFKQQKPDPEQSDIQEDAEEEPIRRRYNPNKPKPDYDEEESETLKAAEQHQEVSKQNSEPISENRLELELNPDRFFLEETDKEQPAEDEHFVENGEDTAVAVPPPSAKNSIDSFGSSKSNKSSLADSLDNPLKSAVSKNGSKRLPVWASILIWLAVTAGVFYGAFMLNSFVKEKYSTYSNCIYQLTDGKIDISSFVE